MTANSGGLYAALPAAPLALGACTSLVKTFVGSLLCAAAAAAAAVPRGAAALLPVPLWPLVKQTSRETRRKESTSNTTAEKRSQSKTWS